MLKTTSSRSRARATPGLACKSASSSARSMVVYRNRPSFRALSGSATPFPRALFPLRVRGRSPRSPKDGGFLCVH
jgi:hypothetical protein